MNQISLAEALNEMEIIKQDKLFPFFSAFTIENEQHNIDGGDEEINPDEESDNTDGNDETTYDLKDEENDENEIEEEECNGCSQYWDEIYFLDENGNAPIPLPLYHPDCQCYVVMYDFDPNKKNEINLELMEQIQNAIHDLQLEIEEIQEDYLNKLSLLLIDYYNSIKEIRPELFDDRVNNWEENEEDSSVKALWEDKVKKEIIDLLTDMLEEIYTTTSSRLRKIYGDHDYPPSKIEFYNKDGKTIEERLDRWYNPYKEKKELKKE